MTQASKTASYTLNLHIFYKRLTFMIKYFQIMNNFFKKTTGIIENKGTFFFIKTLFFGCKRSAAYVINKQWKKWGITKTGLDNLCHVLLTTVLFKTQIHDFSKWKYMRSDSELITVCTFALLLILYVKIAPQTVFNQFVLSQNVQFESIS